MRGLAVLSGIPFKWGEARGSVGPQLGGCATAEVLIAVATLIGMVILAAIVAVYVHKYIVQSRYR